MHFLADIVTNAARRPGPQGCRRACAGDHAAPRSPAPAGTPPTLPCGSAVPAVRLRTSRRTCLGHCAGSHPATPSRGHSSVRGVQRADPGSLSPGSSVTWPPARHSVRARKGRRGAPQSHGPHPGLQGEAWGGRSREGRPGSVREAGCRGRSGCGSCVRKGLLTQVTTALSELGKQDVHPSLLGVTPWSPPKDAPWGAGHPRRRLVHPSGRLELSFWKRHQSCRPLALGAQMPPTCRVFHTPFIPGRGRGPWGPLRGRQGGPHTYACDRRWRVADLAVRPPSHTSQSQLMEFRSILMVVPYWKPESV